MPLVIILTDGAGNVSMGNMPPQEEANFVAARIAEEKIHCIVVNMEHEAFDQGLACDLAKHLESPCYTLGELHAESLYQTVRRGDEWGAGGRMRRREWGTGSGNQGGIEKVLS